MQTCIDLRTFGNRYRVRNETHDRTAHATDDRWDLIIQGRGGFIAPWGRGRLVACTRGSATTNKIMAAVPGARIVQDGSDGQNLTFDPAHLATVAGLLRLRRRRVLTADQRRAAVDRLKRYRYRPSRTSSQSDVHKRAKSPKRGSKPVRPDRDRRTR
jgi:hypothetical protein